jgi:hypothetical protein
MNILLEKLVVFLMRSQSEIQLREVAKAQPDISCHKVFQRSEIAHFHVQACSHFRDIARDELNNVFMVERGQDFHFSKPIAWSRSWKCQVLPTNHRFLPYHDPACGTFHEQLHPCVEDPIVRDRIIYCNE